LVAEGSALERSGGLEEGEAEGTARVFVVRSPAQAERQAAGRAKRLATAEQNLAALPPARGRGQRQITAEAQRVAALDTGRKAPQGEGGLQRAWPQPSERHPHDVGRGRGSATRPQRVTEHIRAHRTRITRQEGPLRALTQRLGWHACVTQAPPERLALRDAIVCSRNAYRIACSFHRLKSRVPIAPLLVQLHDHIAGLPSLLTLGVRVGTVMACALRRSLQNDHATLPGLHPANQTQRTDKPTAERILHAFADVSLTIITQAAGEDIRRRLTPWSGVQETILQCLGLGTALYRQLDMQGIRVVPQ
jgi:transposase